jgi:hypothetical protein
MMASLKFGSAVVASICIAAASTSASAVTAEVAKKCDALVAKEFPPAEPGNPAAGSTKGAPESQNRYFRKCLANGGNVDPRSGKTKNQVNGEIVVKM